MYSKGHVVSALFVVLVDQTESLQHIKQMMQLNYIPSTENILRSFCFEVYFITSLQIIVKVAGTVEAMLTSKKRGKRGIIFILRRNFLANYKLKPIFIIYYLTIVVKI